MAARSLLASLACLAALSGCVDLGHCGPTYTSLSWQQAGLYDALENSTAWRTTWEPGDGALPWQNPWPNLTGLRLQRVSLEVAKPIDHVVGNFAFSDPLLARIELTQDGVVRAMAEGNVSDAAVLAAFHRLANSTTLAPSGQVAAAAQAFLASKVDEGTRSAIPDPANPGHWTERIHWRHQARLPGPFRLEALAQELGLPAPTGPTPGQAGSSTGPWAFDFTLPTWRLEEVGADRSLTTDARGRTVYEGGDHSKGSYEDLVADAAAWAAAHRLPALQLADAEGAAYVC